MALYVPEAAFAGKEADFLTPTVALRCNTG